MNMIEQGVLQQGKLLHLLIRILLLSTICFSQLVSAEKSPADTLPHESGIKKKNVHIIYSPDSTLHSNIAQKITEDLAGMHPEIRVLKATPEEKVKTATDNDIIIGIGSAAIQNANKHYPRVRKLFISTAPNKEKLDKNKNKNDAILYMTQPYCRQIRFIKLLNPRWKTISILSSQIKAVDRKAIKQCANKYDIKVYIVSVSAEENITHKIKHALHHSDVLLALPDSSIYNSKTVKNILLTSYRYRKPVIAFSKNFVTAGALAAIYNSTEQIAQSASKLIVQHFDPEKQMKSKSHPDAFDIEINKQVFMALDLAVPNVENLKETLAQPERAKPGEAQ